MKIRTDFAINRSSSRFIISSDHLSENEKKYFALREMLICHGIMTNEEIDELIDGKLVMEKLTEE